MARVDFSHRLLKFGVPPVLSATGLPARGVLHFWVACCWFTSGQREFLGPNGAGAAQRAAHHRRSESFTPVENGSADRLLRACRSPT